MRGRGADVDTDAQDDDLVLVDERAAGRRKENASALCFVSHAHIRCRWSPRRGGCSRRVGKGRDNAFGHGKANRAPCPPSASTRVVRSTVGTAHESFSFVLMIVPAPLPTLRSQSCYAPTNFGTTVPFL